MVVYEGGIVTFFCNHEIVLMNSVNWYLNGSSVRNMSLPNVFQQIGEYGKHTAYLSLRNISVIFNSTTVECHQEDINASSEIATILVQGKWKLSR